MNHPELYHKANAVQRHDSNSVIQQYSSKIQWRHDGCDSLIDVGSGTGDVLIDFLYPRMSTNFQRLVCSDINPKMVNFARSQYGHIQRVDFKVLDIGTHCDLPSDLRYQFDHVTSFNAMMWVQNQRQGLRNIFDLLRPVGGDCLLMFLASHPTFDAYKLTSQMDKWSKYMYDVDTIIPPLQYSKDPAREYADLMAETGFSDYNVDVEHRIFVYDSLEVFKGNMKAVNPFLDRMPASMHDDYMNDVMSMFLTSLNMKMNNKEYDTGFPVPYRLVIAYARKPPNVLSLGTNTAAIIIQ